MIAPPKAKVGPALPILVHEGSLLVQEGGEVDKTAVAFVVRGPGEQPWLILPAHIGPTSESGETSADWKLWPESILVFTAPKECVRLSLFHAPGIPAFMYAARGRMSDIIGVPIRMSEFEAGGQFENVEIVDLTIPLPDEVLDLPLSLAGFPVVDGAWPIFPPLQEAGGGISDRVALWTGNEDEARGYSGSPIFSDAGALYGMLIGFRWKRIAVIPRSYIVALISGHLGSLPTLDYPAIATLPAFELSKSSRLSGCGAGAINAGTMIVNNIIVTGHLVANAVTDASVATGANAALGSLFTTLLTITKTTTGGPLLIQYTDYCTWSGSGPVINYQVARDGIPLAPTTGGGGTCPDNIQISGSGLDTGASAAPHTFQLQAKYIGANAMSRQPSLIITELKK